MKPCWSVKQWSLWQPYPLPSPQYSQRTVSLGLGCHSPSLLCSPGADQLASRLWDVKAAAQRRYSQRSAHISPAERPAASQPSQVQAIPAYVNNSISLTSLDEVELVLFNLSQPWQVLAPQSCSRILLTFTLAAVCKLGLVCFYMHYACCST